MECLDRSGWVGSKAPEWLEAQKRDPNFISKYAKDHPKREDLSESVLLWFAVRYKSSRITEKLRQTILETIPHRLEYLDKQNFDMSPN